MNARMLLTNRAATTPDNRDLRLRTRTYRAAPDAVIAALETIVPSLRTYGRAWRIARTDGAADAMRTVHVEVPVVVFTDDLIVEITPRGTGSRVEVRSRSRVGKGDLGENRRHLLQILPALDQALASV